MKKFLLIVAAGASIGALGGLIYDKVMKKFNTEEFIEDDTTTDNYVDSDIDIDSELSEEETEDIEDEVDDTEDEMKKAYDKCKSNEKSNMLDAMFCASYEKHIQNPNIDSELSEEETEDIEDEVDDTEDMNIIFTNYEMMLTSVQWYDNPNKHIIAFIDFQKIESNTSNEDLLKVLSSDIEKERLFTSILNKAKGFDTYFSDIIINGFYPEESIMIKRKNGKKRAIDMGIITVPSYIVQKVLEQKLHNDEVFVQNMMEASISSFFEYDVEAVDFTSDTEDDRHIELIQCKNSGKMNFLNGLSIFDEKSFIYHEEFVRLFDKIFLKKFLEKINHLPKVNDENFDIQKYCDKEGMFTVTFVVTKTGDDFKEKEYVTVNVYAPDIAK